MEIVGDATEEASAAQSFRTLWNTLVGVLGTGATATLLRRAARRAARHRPDLAQLSGFDVIREEMTYRCVLPPSWSGNDEGSVQALAYLVQEELYPLLEELTGPVMIRLLERQPELARSRIVGAQEGST